MLLPILLAPSLLSLLPTASVTTRRQSMSPSRRTVRMGGFEQTQFGKSGVNGARLSLVLSGVDATRVQLACRGQPSIDQPSGVRGTVYKIDDQRVEVVAEGQRPQLEQLSLGVGGLDGATVVHEAWQQPPSGGSGYESFPLVELSPKMRGEIVLEGTPVDLDTISRQLQVEAVFNRGLKLSDRARPRPDRLELTSSGELRRLKSFVRWCYVGPPLARPECVRVKWSPQ